MQSVKPLFGRKIRKPISGKGAVNLLTFPQLNVDDYIAGEYLTASSNVKDFTAIGIVTTPTIGAPAITQIQILVASGIYAAPTVGAPVLVQVLPVYNLTAVGVNTGQPTVDEIALVQKHVFVATGIFTGAPITPEVAAKIIYNITPDGILIGTAVLDKPIFIQLHGFTALGILTTPEVGLPSIGGSARFGQVIVGNTWLEVVESKIVIGNEWKDITEAYCLVSGEWKKVTA